VGGAVVLVMDCGDRLRGGGLRDPPRSLAWPHRAARPNCAELVRPAGQAA